MFSTDFIFRQKENLVDNQKCQAGFRQLCNKILFQDYEVKALLGNSTNQVIKPNTFVILQRKYFVCIDCKSLIQ